MQNKTKRWAKATLALGFIIASATMRAQSPTWTNITPPGWSGSFTQVTVANGRGFLALANNGYYYISPDTGRTWSPQATPDTSMIALAMYPGNTSGIMYNAATMYATTDAARTWAKLPRSGIPADMIIRTVWAKNADTLLMAATNKVNGLRIFMSGNRGQNWKQVAQDIVNDFGYYNTINTFTFSSPLVGFGYGYGCYISTTDGGETWTNHINDGVTDSYIGNYTAAFTYPSGRTLMFWCDYYRQKAEIRSSPDGDPVNASTVSTTAEAVSSVVAIGEKMYATDLTGHLYTSNDSGATWSSKVVLSRSTNCNLFCSFLDENAGVAVSYYLTSMVTTDGGSTWNKHVHGAAEGLNNVYCKTEKECYITGQGGRLFHTTNGGETWDYNDLDNQNIENITFPSKDTGYVSGYRTLFRTIDGGQNWLKFTGGNNGGYLNFPSNDTGYIGMSTDGTLDRSIDAGQSWYIAADMTFIDNSGYGGSAGFKTASEGLSGSYSNLLMHTVDAGVTWEVKSLTNTNAAANTIVPTRHGWVVLATFDSTVSGLQQRFVEIYTCDSAINSKRVMMFQGDGGTLKNVNDTTVCLISNTTIYFSHDEGVSWESFDFSNGCSDVSFPSDHLFYGVGEYSVYKIFLQSKLSITSFSVDDRKVSMTVSTGSPSSPVDAVISVVNEQGELVYSLDKAIANGQDISFAIPESITDGAYIIKIVPVDTVSFLGVSSTSFTIKSEIVAETLSASFTPQSSTAIQVTVSTTGFSGTCALLLSDAAGSFASATVVDTALLATGVATSVALPAGIAPGTGYKLRIVPLDSLHYLPCTSQAFAIATSAAGEPAVGDQPRVKVVGGRVLCGCAGAEVFSSLGVRVATGALLPPGVYVARCGGRVTEVVVK